MPLSHREVHHVARLAHLGLRDEEIDELAAELSGVLAHIDHLRSVDTTGVAPTAHVANLESVMRDDVVRASWPPEAVLANAPRQDDQQFAVKAILD